MFVFNLVSGTFNLLLIRVPLFVIKSIPRCENLISLTHLYVFMQALGILWLLFVTAVAVAATKLGSVGIDGLFSFSLPIYILRLYIHFSIFQVGVGFGKSLWSNGWEIYGDFPTGRAILNPKSALTRSTRVAQKLFLLCPLVVSTVLAAVLGLVQLSLHLYPPGTSESPSIRSSLGDPDSRLNRVLRFTVWIGLLQWAQMFQFVFPSWPRAVFVFSIKKRICLLVGFLVLVPISVVRCLQWVVVLTPPSDAQLRSVLYVVFGGISWDCVLMVSWGLVMHAIAREILGSKSHLALANWKRHAFVDVAIWCEGATLLKFGFLGASLLLFVRSFLSPHKGFAYGQNDLLVLTVSYPLYVVLTCWTTAIVLTLRGKWGGITILLLGPLSASLCAISGITGGGAVGGFWLHLIKNFVRLKQHITCHSASKIDSVGPRSANGSERIVARSLLKMALPFTYMYGLLVLILSVLSLVQKHVALAPPNEYMSVVRPDATTISVRHAVSEMNLFLSPRDENVLNSLPRYAVCEKKFWGLDAVDYGLFSMISYIGDPALTEKATREIFPPNWNISIHHENGYADKFWTEFHIQRDTETLIVLAVRGSEFWRVSDYLEDLRMWTEPVAKSLLTLVFPTVRAWSPQTTAMVFDAYQEILAFIGIPDDVQYKYQRLLEYIEHRGTPMVLTGHSLGGGIASITGAIAKLPTVTFLSPGMYQTASKFFYHRKDRQFVDQVHHQSVSIQVENDFVGKFLDSHAGLVQTITCSVDHLAPLTCHLVDNSVCNLIRHCQDPRWPGGCDFKYDFDIFINATFPEESYQRLHQMVLGPAARLLNRFFDPKPHREEL